MCKKRGKPPPEERPWESTITTEEWQEFVRSFNAAAKSGVLRITEWNPPNYWAALYQPSAYGYADQQQATGGYNVIAKQSRA